MTSPQEPPVDKDAMPSPLSWELTQEQEDNISGWLTERFRQEWEGKWRCTCVPPGCSYESYGGPDPECPMHRQPVDKTTEAADVMAEVRRLARSLRDSPPPRTEPIKLTSDQWALIPHGTPNPYGPLTPAGDLLGVPVVMVTDESESTPVVEGWIKSKEPPSRRWWQRLWHWRRS